MTANTHATKFMPPQRVHPKTQQEHTWDFYPLQQILNCVFLLFISHFHLKLPSACGLMRHLTFKALNANKTLWRMKLGKLFNFLRDKFGKLALYSTSKKMMQKISISIRLHDQNLVKGKKI